MRSITTTLPAMRDLFPLDPSPQRSTRSSPIHHPQDPQPSRLEPPSQLQNSAMDLQFILGPTTFDQRRQRRRRPQSPHPPVVLQDGQHLVSNLSTVHIPPRPQPSSSHSEPHPAPVIQNPGEHVHSNPDDAIISFDSKTRSFRKPFKASAPTAVDPWAEDYLRDMLGAHKWETFSSRLFERRLVGKVKGTGKDKPGEEEAKLGVDAIEFLVKVEVVKEILRTYVPHPYNPLKSLTHPYSRAPTGQVTLTRSTVLLLSGWSNTQFSYWARRSEAVSVLAKHDPRLRAVGVALQRRLEREPKPQVEDEDDPATVTGKGLDAIIDEVKKRTGKSQFLRGKHSSLDPYGTTVVDLTPQEPISLPEEFAMPTFQAERYDHGTRRIMDLDLPPSLGPHPPPVSPPALPKPRLRPISPAGSAHSEAMSDSHGSQPTPLPSPTSPSDRASSQNESPSPHTTGSSIGKAGASDSNAYHFPVSDSRSEFENATASAKRKPAEPHKSSQKRARTEEEPGATPRY